MEFTSISDLLMSAVAAFAVYLGSELKSYVKRRETEKRNMELRKVAESTITNAIDYVKDVFESEQSKRPGLTKEELALEYVAITEPDVEEHLGRGRLKVMIKRRYIQVKKLKQI